MTIVGARGAHRGVFFQPLRFQPQIWTADFDLSHQVSYDGTGQGSLRNFLTVEGGTANPSYTVDPRVWLVAAPDGSGEVAARFTRYDADHLTVKPTGASPNSSAALTSVGLIQQGKTYFWGWRTWVPGAGNAQSDPAWPVVTRTSGNFAQIAEVYGQPFALTVTHPNTGGAGIGAGSTVTAIPLATALTKQLFKGQRVILTSGGNSQTFYLTADAPVGTTTLAVGSQTASFTFPAGSAVTSSYDNRVWGAGSPPWQVEIISVDGGLTNSFVIPSQFVGSFPDMWRGPSITYNAVHDFAAQFRFDTFAADPNDIASGGGFLRFWYDGVQQTFRTASQWPLSSDSKTLGLITAVPGVNFDGHTANDLYHNFYARNSMFLGLPGALDPVKIYHWRPKLGSTLASAQGA